VAVIPPFEGTPLTTVRLVPLAVCLVGLADAIVTERRPDDLDAAWRTKLGRHIREGREGA
jgi:hypothetical protein